MQCNRYNLPHYIRQYIYVTFSHMTQSKRNTELLRATLNMKMFKLLTGNGDLINTRRSNNFAEQVKKKSQSQASAFFSVLPTSLYFSPPTLKKGICD